MVNLKTIITGIALSSAALSASAQSSFISSGGSLSGSGGKVDYSIGMTFTEVISNDQYRISPEIQIPVEVITQTEASEKDGTVSLFPNPVGDRLVIGAAFATVNVLSISDLAGRFLTPKFSWPNVLDFSNYSSGIYFITIRVDEYVVKKRIIKL